MLKDAELETPELWVAHYYLLLADDENESSDLVEPLFGISEDRIEEYYLGHLVQPEATARTLWLPLLDGFSAGVQYADCGDDGHEVRYFLHHAPWSEPELLGFDSAHFALPAFRWDEVTLVHAALREQGTAQASAAALFLFPATYLTSSEEQAEAESRLAEWWKTLSVIRPRAIDTLAKNVAAYRFSPEVRWSVDAKLGWINDGMYSFRNPRTEMCAFSERRFERVRSFLAPLGA